MMEAKTPTNKNQRPPIVVVVGHVDHGKTTLLDYVRKTNVAMREAGGITQSIGAYEITTRNGRRITFIDTPGHEAFSHMRSRGAEVADIGVLLIAADEGVKPQTKEAIDILRETKTPFIVAINKIDKTGDMERAKKDLMDCGVMLEGYGGQTSFHGISAKTGEGVPELLDLILLAADLEHFVYDPDAAAEGYVLEARRDPRRGAEATVVIQNGVLKRGDPIYTKTAKGKVRTLENFLGKPAEALMPSSPARVVGFETLPNTGEVFSTSDIFDQARLAPEGARAKESRGKKGTLALILKAADMGSLEALGKVIRSVAAADAAPDIISESIGDVTDGDIKHAIATGAVVVGFKNKVERGAKNLADAHRIQIISSDVVYDLEKVVKEFLAGLLGPQAIGELDVLAVFNQDKLEKQIIGGKVTKGIVKVKAPFDFLSRAQAQANAASADLPQGKILGLRDRKTEIQSAEAGKEIGLLVNCPARIASGDTLVIRK